ncbi:lysis system i-spanin subunit Rz [Klebsiella variicola]|uniref:lysis system i-spanin subunit Rz n=1 Tax=Klebsiella variicola TaxID=244366 RepID=UPI00101BDF22|nr:lysis system i-spanin subunit Rz [Klebsiella variicola]
MNIPSLFQPGWKWWPGWKWCGIALLCGALLGALATWWVTDNKFTADIATIKQQHAEDLKAISDEASFQRDRIALQEHTFAAQNAVSDLKHTKELTDALAENKALRESISNGSRQLQLAKAGLATCNLSKSATSSASGLGDAGTIAFSDDFGRNIYDIRAGIISDQQKLKALQDYIRSAQDAGVIAK